MADSLMQNLPKPFFALAHNIRSLLNVGSIFRTADAFGVTRLYLTGYTGTPGNSIHRSKITKTALGAEKYVPWEHHKSAGRLIKKLKADGVHVVALENNLGSGFKPFPTELPKFKPKFPLALILGEEVRGVPKPLLKLADVILEIPMHGKKESLNVSVAFGVAAYVISQFN